MRRGIGVSLFSAAVLVCGCAQQPQQQAAQPADQSQKEAAAAPALNGQVPKADQDSGRSQKPYAWNMRLVGQQDIQNRGENGNLGWIGDCAYVSAYYGGNDPLEGMAVIDANNPKNPELVKLEPGTPGTRESQVEANEARKIVIVMPFRHPKTPYGDPPGPSQLQIYDASADCKAPTRVGTYDFGNMVTHEHRISLDGKTVYATVTSWADPNSGNSAPANNADNTPQNGRAARGAAAAGAPAAGGRGRGNRPPNGDPNRPPALLAIDISDLAHPKQIASWSLADEPGMPKSGMHDLDVNDDGTRAYTNSSWQIDGVRHQGLTILDTSEVQARKPNAKITRVSSFNWGPPENFGGSHSSELVTIKGRQYVICEDETMGVNAAAPWGWARIIDVTDEKYPLQISTITLDASKAENADKTNPDKAYYGAHYLGVDDYHNASLAFFSWYSSGLRAWDIRDPYLPKEIGYYIPGARVNTKLPSSDSYPNAKVDYVYSFIRYRPETGQIWFNSLFNGFMIAELIDNPIRKGAAPTATTASH
jgi:hypothetical protein